jgi:1-acyl-sn-glycerol-3-phosphate acyltransferase
MRANQSSPGGEIPLFGAVKSALIWAGIGGITIAEYPFCAITSLLASPLDRTRAVGHWWATRWGRWCLKVNPAWSCTFDQTRLPRDRHFVIVANHESMGDILVAFHMDHHFKWIAKEVIFKVPFMGWFMHQAGYIPLRRGDKDSVVKCMETARAWLRKGVSVLFFPEGTRSPDGAVRDFKPGAFRLAIETGVDILPVAITGTKDSLPKHSWRFSSQKSALRGLVGDPISVQGLTADDLPALMDRTRDAIVVLKNRLDGVEEAPIRHRAAV